MQTANYKSDEIIIFDHAVKRVHRDRAANLLPGNDFLISEVAERIAEHFNETITRKFPDVLDLGCRAGNLSDRLKQCAGAQWLVKSDLSIKQLNMQEGVKLVSNEELLPFKPESFDLVVCNLNLHWVNDLPGCLVQIRHILKKKGLFVATILGGDTLCELKQATNEAEIAVSGGISPRFSPLTLVKDAGRLLQRAGFTMPVTNSEVITVMYKDVFALIKDLRAMAETNALIKRNKSFTGRKVIMEISEKYQQLFANNAGNIPATFEIITLSGWKD